MTREARRPVFRWGLRLFKRDWRQQTLVLALLVCAVAAASFGSAAAYAAVPSMDGAFGHAQARIEFRVQDPARVADDIAMFRADFGDLEVVSHRTVPIPGAVNVVDFRDQAPGGRFGAPMLALLAGRYPQAPDELAVTARVARDFRTRVGARVRFDGRERSVVGLVENPARLDDEFALAARGTIDAETVALLVGENRTTRPGKLRSGAGYSISGRGADESAVAAAVVLMIATILLGLVGLVAAAGFAVVAHRRQRQLGMLAAVGASDRQLRLVMLSNGVAVGVTSAVAGSCIAGAVWLAAHGALERAFGQRIEPAEVPVWIPLANAALAVAAATAAAWWPARALARLPITDALSGRPPRAGRVHRSILLAVCLLVAGLAALALGVNTVTDDANVAVLAPGALALVAGVLVLSPIAIRGLARGARRAPLPLRLAVRELNRHQARSGAALAAITLGLGIAVATVVVAAAAQRSADEGDLSHRHLLVRSETDAIPQERLADAQATRDDIVTALGPGTQVFPLSVAMKRADAGPAGARDAATLAPLGLARKVGERSFRFVAEIYVATPELLAWLGVTPGSDVDVVTAAQEPDLHWLTLGGRLPPATIQRFDGPGYSALPTTLITPHGLAKAGAEVHPRGWFLAADHTLSADEIAAARTAAVGARLAVQSRDAQDGLAATRTIATGVGVLVALCLLGMTVGLIRSESGRDLQTLVAAGATTFTRRALSAATSASLAFLGSVLGIVGAYAGLIAIYSDRLSSLDAVPIAELSVLLLGLPLLAAAAGYVLSGREPAVITRKALA